jgi:hypothetical protein
MPGRNSFFLKKKNKITSFLCFNNYYLTFNQRKNTKNSMQLSFTLFICLLNIVNCFVTISYNPVQEELAGAKSEIHKWHSTFDNSAATPPGATPGLHLNLRTVSEIIRWLDYQQAFFNSVLLVKKY